MTRKHYIAVAQVLAAANEQVGYLSPDALIKGITEGLADVFAADNPRFDRQRFIAAATA